MNEFKGTKGKLKLVEVKNGIGKGVYLSGENQKYFIAQIITHDRTEEENNSNGLLFSKAPELLESLNEITSTFTDEELSQCITSFSEKIKRAKQLIKEATTL